MVFYTLSYVLGLIIIMFWLLGLLTSTNLPGFIEIVSMLMIMNSTNKVIRKKFEILKKSKE